MHLSKSSRQLLRSLPRALALLLVLPLAHWQGPPRDDDPAPENVETAQMELQWESEDSVYVTGSIREILEYNAEVIPENPLADYLWPDSGLAVMAIIILGYLWGRVVIREKGIFPDRRYAAARWLVQSCGGTSLYQVVPEPARVHREREVAGLEVRPGHAQQLPKAVLSAVHARKGRRAEPH